jgi:penicillin-insensitive murein endopeptidase
MKIILFLWFLVGPCIAKAQIYDWHLVVTPTASHPKIYGTYSAGCMDGGIKLPARGEGYIHGDVHDNRAYGQPELIDYIAKLGKEASGIERTLIIGDLASPRGGPAPITSSLHQSHQTGLDVDIWLRSARKSENADKIRQISMVDRGNNSINTKYWGVAEVEILARAASFAEVDRIFVNPVIKKELCSKYAGEEWMHKIRAWWGHAEHFHVRLKCPENNPDCVMQKPVPDGDGCGKELAWWFSDEAKLTNSKLEPRKEPVLPKECVAVYGR